MTANACLHVDLQAVLDNTRHILKEIGPGTKLIPVLKGNAYGLGALQIAETLSALPLLDTFAVSQVAEGLELRRAGFRQRILVMSLPLPFQLEEAVQQDLTLTLGGFHQLAPLRELSAKLGRRIPVSLKVDTGLHRIGFDLSEAGALCDALRRMEGALEIVGTFSHFSGDNPELSARQESLFRLFVNRLRTAGISPGLCHMGSSASVEAGQGLGLGAVRVGRRLFLDNPVSPSGAIREAFSLRAFLTDVRDRPAGTSLGYGAGITLPEDTRIGILSMGYGDGLDPALAHAGAPVLIGGFRARLLGCCMDQSFVDLGCVPAAPGDEVTLFGEDREGRLLSAQEVASLIGCEGVDLTSRLTPRVSRVYHAPCGASSSSVV